MPDSEDEPVAVVEADGAAEVDRAEEGGSSLSAVGERHKDSAVGGLIVPKAWAAIKADKNTPEPCEIYFDLLAPSVEERLAQVLRGTKTGGRRH